MDSVANADIRSQYSNTVLQQNFGRSYTTAVKGLTAPTDLEVLYTDSIVANGCQLQNYTTDWGLLQSLGSGIATGALLEGPGILHISAYS